MSKNYNDKAMKTVRKCRKIKKEIVQFHKIELGQGSLLKKFGGGGNKSDVPINNKQLLCFFNFYGQIQFLIFN